MSLYPLVSEDGTTVDHSRIEQLRTACRGALIGAGDAAYDSARRIWNASIDKHPGLIVRASGLADVIAAVRFARQHRLLVAIRGGGHNVGGRALCDGGLVIDLSPMKGIHVDARACGSSLASRSASWIAKRTCTAWQSPPASSPRPGLPG